MQRVDVDGVPVFWRQGPEPLTATLMFRVGRRDEIFLGGGVTHLVEHLVMRDFGRTHLDCNASVDLSATFFTATGRPEAVKSFLASVCRSLRDLPVEAIETEKSVLRREGGLAAHPLECAALAARYGARDLGLASLMEPAMGTVTGDQVREWSARHFVTENAALALTGAPPPDLSLVLPVGARNARQAPEHRPIPVPAWTSAAEGAAAAFLATYSQALMAGLRVALDRMTHELRHGRGEAYDVDFFVSGVDSATDLTHVTFVSDPEDKRAGSVANQMLDILGKLADDGPTKDELSHDHAGMVEAFSDPRSVDGEVCSFASSHLAGRALQSNEEQIEEHRALTPAAVASALSPLARTALVVVPEDVEFARPRFRKVPVSCGEPIAGRQFKRRPFGSWAPPGARLYLDGEGLSIVQSDGKHWTARWSEVQGVGTDRDRVHYVQSMDGACVPIRAADWRGGGEIIKALEAGVPTELFFRDHSEDQQTWADR